MTTIEEGRGFGSRISSQGEALPVDTGLSRPGPRLGARRARNLKVENNGGIRLLYGSVEHALSTRGVDS